VSFAETLRTALQGIQAHRLRSGLTMLGILIGIAAVILTVGLGQGAQQQVSDQIDKLGSHLLIVSPGSTTSNTGVRGGRGTASTLSTRDAIALSSKEVAPDIAAVAPISSGSQTAVAGTTNWTTTVVGTVPAWLDVRARTVTEGRFISQADIAAGRKVAVIGTTTASELFSGRSPIGQTVTVNGTALTVIGELNTAGTSAAGDEDDQLVVPQTTYADSLSTSTNRNSVTSIYLEARSQGALSAAYQEADSALNTLHGTTAAAADFSISSQQSLLATATSTSKTLTVLLAGVAAISLLVGGLGVMNIMLVAVTERIREIGLRKALGATPSAIRRQFLLEASSLGFTGGVLGLVLGIVGALFLPSVLNQPVTISPWAAIVAIAVALVIGVVAGVYPASRAARLAPIDALRSE
jgi:putative ABC transport system permease protein